MICGNLHLCYLKLEFYVAVMPFSVCAINHPSSGVKQKTIKEKTREGIQSTICIAVSSCSCKPIFLIPDNISY